MKQQTEVDCYRICASRVPKQYCFPSW